LHLKAIQLVTRGNLAGSCQCIEIPEPDATAPGQISVAIKASAINPADLLIFEDKYPGPEQLPAFVGIEGAGEVIGVGAGVSTFSIGDHVISMGHQHILSSMV